MPSPISIREIASMRMCVGCGACAYLGADRGVSMRDYPDVGRRPVFPDNLDDELDRRMAAICPGMEIRSLGDRPRAKGADEAEALIGHTEAIWEGWAADPLTRFAASSGGVVSALACYCLEVEHMALVLHTGMNEDQPWLNETKISRSRSEVLLHCGSRYAPSSPVEALAAIESSNGPCVFIGKPCDAAAVQMLRGVNHRLDENLGLVLSFFCAGVPSTSATIDMARRLGVGDESQIRSLRYRGRGWPGNFSVSFKDGREASASYEDAWGFLSGGKRQLRCNLCPDGLGELSDVSCGDAWNRRAEGSDGISCILARTPRGMEYVERAIEAGYIEASGGNSRRVVEAQGLVERRKYVSARCAALRLFGLPAPTFQGFELRAASSQAPLIRRAREFVGMIRRILVRSYRRPEPRC